MTALPAAVRARIPRVVIAGEAPLKSGWYNQDIDQAPFVTATGAAYVPLHWSARMAEGLRDAFLQARMERRPVVVGIPFDLQSLAAPSSALPPPSRDLVPQTSPMPPHPDDLARAEGLSDAGAVFGRTDLAALPDLIAAFGRDGGAALWNIPISDRVASPVMRRAHPPSH